MKLVKVSAAPIQATEQHLIYCRRPRGHLNLAQLRFQILTPPPRTHNRAREIQIVIAGARAAEANPVLNRFERQIQTAYDAADGGANLKWRSLPAKFKS